MFTFTTWSLLLGIGLVAVPVVLHLLMRQQPKHLEFPALRLIRQRNEANRRRLRLRHLLLLLLRAAAIALLALALARPLVQSQRSALSGNAPVAAALVFDTGPRMEYRHQNETRLEAAQDLGHALLSQLPAESQVAVVDPGSSVAEFDLDRGLAGVHIDQLAVAPTSQSLLTGFDRAVALVRKSDLPAKEIFLFTDLAAAQWGGDQTPLWQQRLRENPDIAVFVMDVAAPQPQNFSLGPIELSNQVISQNGSVALRSELLREGDAGTRVVRLYLLDPDGKPAPKGEGTYACDANAAAQIEFKLAALPVGTHQGYIEIVDDDPMPQDNRRYFTLRTAAPWKVLIAAPDPAAQRALQVTQVLAPSELKRQGRAEFDCDVVDFAALAAKPLDGYAAVWLLDPPPLPDAVWRKLVDYATAGHGVAVALGPRAGPSGQAMNNSAAQSLLPGPLKLLMNTGGEELYLAPQRLEHPIFSRLREMQGTIPWEKNPVFKYWQIGPLREGAHTVLAYGNGQPAVIEQPVGRGRVITLTTSLTESSRYPWNLLLLPQRDAWPGFALVWGIAQQLVGRVDEQTNYHVGETAVIKVDPDDRFDTLLLQTPLSDIVKIRQVDGVVSFNGTQTPGHYRLSAGGQSDVRRGFSVNLDPAATRITKMDEAAFKLAFEKSNLQAARDSKELVVKRRAGETRGRWELYPWLMLAVALCVVGETLLSSLFYRRSEN